MNILEGHLVMAVKLNNFSESVCKNDIKILTE